MGNEIDLHGIRLVSWDVDGTLYSYIRLTLELLRRRRFSLRELRESLDFHRSVEKQRRSHDCRVIPSEMELVRISQRRERDALDAALRRIPPRPCALEFIRQFAAVGITQVALSDFECRYKLDALGISRHFVKAYSCEDLGFWKPSPIPLHRIQDDFHIHPSQHLHIGDRLDTDGEACIRNGCRFLLIGGMPTPATLLLQTETMA